MRINVRLWGSGFVSKMKVVLLEQYRFLIISPVYLRVGERKCYKNLNIIPSVNYLSVVCKLRLCPATPCGEASRSLWSMNNTALCLPSRSTPSSTPSVSHKYSRPHRGHFPEGPPPASHPLSVWRQGTGERLNGLVLAWRQHAGIYLCFAFFPCSILHTSLLFCLLLCFRPGPQTSARPHTQSRLSQHPLKCLQSCSKHNLTGGRSHWQHRGVFHFTQPVDL